MDAGGTGPVDDARLLTIPQAAARLSISRSTAYQLVAAGRLETVHIGRACRIPADAVDDFVASLRGSDDVRIGSLAES
jgi:excisionase family DNA binding protein